jgi:hypothetical protein
VTAHAPFPPVEACGRLAQEPPFANARLNNRIADKPAFCPRSILNADLASVSVGRGLVSAATQHSSRERAFANPPPDQNYTGHLPQLPDLTGLRTNPPFAFAAFFTLIWRG